MSLTFESDVLVWNTMRSVVARLYERFKIKMSPELMGLEEETREVVFDLLRA